MKNFVIELGMAAASMALVLYLVASFAVALGVLQ
jgi:hypothetical protein